MFESKIKHYKNIGNMNHFVNINFPKGYFRIVCTQCNKVFVQEHGGLTQGGLASMKYPKLCDECNGEVVLETNPD